MCNERAHDLGWESLLLTFEFTLVLWLQGITIRESIASRDPVSGSVYAASLVLFALMPLLVSMTRDRQAYPCKP